jgi:hypothetical protein
MYTRLFHLFINLLYKYMISTILFLIHKHNELHNIFRTIWYDFNTIDFTYRDI